MKKILIINPFGIGDVLFSTPLVKALKKRYPDLSITYICNKRAYGVLAHNPRISKIHIFEKDEYKELWDRSKIRGLKKIYSLMSDIRKEGYDAAIDMSLGYISSLLLATIGGVPSRVGFNYRKRGRFLTYKVDVNGFSEKHVIEYYFELGKPFGLDTSDKTMELFISKEDQDYADDLLAKNGILKGQKICAIIPGCGASWGQDAVYRRWSPWKFSEVADYIAAKYGHRIAIFGEAKELALCLKAESGIKHGAIQMCGKTTLGQLTALLDRCDIVITNDGGPLHLAVALGKKTVSIFGPVDEHVYGPYPRDGRHITISSDESCRPCYRNFKHSNCDAVRCLSSIRPDKALAAVDILMGQ